MTADDWQGPLAHLLAEARRQRVDLTRISMAALVADCLARLSACPTATDRAEMIVTAATLVEMKAALLAPKRAEADAAAAVLRGKLLSLAHVQELGEALMAAPQLGRDVFARGMPEAPAPPRMTGAGAALVDLIAAYARLRVEDDAAAPPEIRRFIAVTLREGLRALRQALPQDQDWRPLFDLLGEKALASRGATTQSVTAATLFAALEMARVGEIELRQDEPFGALRLRRIGGAGL